MDTALSLVHQAFGADPDWKQVVLTLATPIFVLAFVLEWWVMRRRQRLDQFPPREILVNLGLGSLYQVFELIAWVAITGVAANWVYSHRLFDIALNAWTAAPIFVAVEFLYYGFHRSSHRIRWFWSAHVVHHSGQTMNMSTAMRQGLLYSVTGWWLFFMPLVWLGVDPAVVFFMYAIDLFYQYFIHTEAVGKLHPAIEYLFNTPSHHRAHHGRNPGYIDRNFGGVLIVFDRWCGTFVEEAERPDYGIPRQPQTRNLLTLNFHEFLAMWRDLARPGPLGQRLKHLWGPPEWKRPQT
ncbi:MAG: sterol desaturase family protein [Burkholderiaceae bacterium]